MRPEAKPNAAPVVALLGPTNTGKTHQAIERMLEHDSGMIGLPLRLLAREVYDLFVQICPIVFDVTLADTDRARDLLLDGRDFSARDAVHAAVMLNHDIEWIATFDAGFDRIPGIRRLDTEESR
jgi:hypothetical protein